MKNKILSFIKQKKELLIYIGILSLVFISVFTIANFMLDDTTVENEVVENPDPIVVAEPKEKFQAPINTEYRIVRGYYDMSYETSDQLLAIITVGTTMKESKGVSYQSSVDDDFNVYSVFSGTVSSVEESEINGTVITIKHDNSVVSKYYSLDKANVSVGDKVTQNTAIGSAGESLFDSEAGVHVHLEVITTNGYLDATTLENKTIDELIESK